MKANTKFLKILPWIISALIMVVIFLMSATSGDTIGDNMEVVEDLIQSESSNPSLTQKLLKIDWLKIGHFIGYSMLGCSLYFAYLQNSEHPLLFVVLTVLFYASTDEFHQTFVPGRSGSPIDVVLDVSSASLMAVVLHFISKRKSTLTSNH